MRGTQLHWIEGPWPGRLAMAARPRGGDWLADELASWQESGISTVLSLLEEQEERDLDLQTERDAVEKSGLKFVSFPIPDRDVPASASELGKVLDILHSELASGKDVVVHCRQGVGRTGLVSACLLICEGISPLEAFTRLKSARGVDVPETAEQHRWILSFANALAFAR